ncbi:MAG: integration host factor subunit alpha [Wolbachia sp.]
MTIKGTTITKATIIESINREIGLSKEDSAAIIDDILNEIKTSLAKDGIVKIPSFGTFLIRRKEERPGNVPNTSKRVIIQARNSISFRPSQILKKLINNQ